MDAAAAACQVGRGEPASHLCELLSTLPASRGQAEVLKGSWWEERAAFTFVESSARRRCGAEWEGLHPNPASCQEPRCHGSQTREAPAHTPRGRPQGFGIWVSQVRGQHALWASDCMGQLLQQATMLEFL